MKYTLLPLTRKLIQNYLKLKIGPFRISCPYYQNLVGKRAGAVFVGKGSPAEIERETLRLFRKFGKNLKDYDKASLRYNMVMAGIGIDCSGLATRILDSLLKEKGLGGIRKNTRPSDFSPFSLLRHYLRPFTNISADTLSGFANCVEVKDINNVIPGDLIRAGSRHVAVITEVEKRQKNVTKVTYCHSTWDYLDQYGVRTGNIFLTNPNLPLERQKWDEYYRGRNWMLKDYLKALPSDRGIRRLKALLGRP